MSSEDRFLPGIQVFLRSQFESDVRLVRIWYTINGSSQYILARPPEQFPVQFLARFPDENQQHDHLYATTLLTTCARAIHSCRYFHSVLGYTYLPFLTRPFSPELMHNDSQDFSLYVLDPFEGQAAPHATVLPCHNSNAIHGYATIPHSPGVAVAMGLMSWALSSTENSSSVTGTLVKSPTGEIALEVIFALREVCSIF